MVRQNQATTYYTHGPKHPWAVMTGPYQAGPACDIFHNLYRDFLPGHPHPSLRGPRVRTRCSDPPD
jgi:hypothetical protein